MRSVAVDPWLLVRGVDRRHVQIAEDIGASLESRGHEVEHTVNPLAPRNLVAPGPDHPPLNLSTLRAVRSVDGVDELEIAAGLDLWSSLPDGLEDEIEKATP